MTHLPAFRPRALLFAGVLLPGLLSAQSGLVVTQHMTYNVAKITSADLTQTVSILGNDRARTVTTGKTKVLIISADASGTEIIRLDKDSLYRINDKKKEYTAKSFADLRADLAKQQKDAEKQASDVKPEEYRYSVVVDEAKNTGERQTINGFATEHVVIKLTVMAENTKTKETKPAYHIVSDSWLDKTQSEAGRASLGYHTAMVKAMGIDPAMAANPYAKWLTSVSVEAGKFDGYPIKSTLTMTLHQDSSAAAAPAAPSRPPTSVQGAILGGMFGSKKKEEPAPSGGMVMFTSMTEVTAISFRPPGAAEFEIPAGYVKK